jgi:signal transduction histidine kinase
VPRRNWLARLWARQSLRRRITLVATALFGFAVATGAILVVVLQRYALVRTLDQTATAAASDAASDIRHHRVNSDVLPNNYGVTAVEVFDADNIVRYSSPGADRLVPVLTSDQIADARKGLRFEVTSPASGASFRVLGRPAGSSTVIAMTDLRSVDDSVRLLTQAALIGGPIAVLLMGSATYLVARLTLRPVATLRHGAADITAAGLANQRLPEPASRDEIHQLATTLNDMLDRIDASTKRQRTFVGDAAHELRSPLASLRVQLEVAQRMGPATDWPTFLDEALVDVGRLDRLVDDLLTLARQDESGGTLRRQEPVELRALLVSIIAGYQHARVPVRLQPGPPAVVIGDTDALRRIFINLIENALRFATTGVDVALGPGAVADLRTAIITVSDDGPGIAPHERERVFDRFYRVEQSRSRESGGTGLGLPIVRDLVRAHGGSVRLTGHDAGPGLQAIVVLPLGPPPPAG